MNHQVIFLLAEKKSELHEEEKHLSKLRRMYASTTNPRELAHRISTLTEYCKRLMSDIKVITVALNAKHNVMASSWINQDNNAMKAPIHLRIGYLLELIRLRIVKTCGQQAKHLGREHDYFMRQGNYKFATEIDNVEHNMQNYVASAYGTIMEAVHAVQTKDCYHEYIYYWRAKHLFNLAKPTKAEQTFKKKFKALGNGGSLSIFE